MNVQRAVSLAVALFVFGSAADASSAHAAKTKLLSIGEVVSPAPNGQTKLGLVRSTLEQELETIDWRKSTKMKSYVVSVSVVTLATETTRGKSSTTCVLSTTLRNAKTGSVVLIVNQSVRAETTSGHARSMEDGALRAAASAAIRKIPSALASSPG